MAYSFKNKVVLVTGSNLGIGKATARLLASMGAKVVLNGRTVDRLENTRSELAAAGAEVMAVAADVTSYTDCVSMIDKIMEHFQQIDVVINNAGVSMRGDFETVDPSVFKTVMEVNYLGAVNVSHAALPALKKSKGRIMFVSSVAGIRGLQSISAYCPAKMALTALAESLKIELHSTGIKVGITYVGYTQNDPLKRTIAADGRLIPIEARSEKNAQTTDQVAKAIVRNIEKGRFKRVLTKLGKLNALANKLIPRLVDRILIRANERFKMMAK